MDRKTERQAGRQTGRQAVRQAGRQAVRQVHCKIFYGHLSCSRKELVVVLADA